MDLRKCIYSNIIIRYVYGYSFYKVLTMPIYFYLPKQFFNNDLPDEACSSSDKYSLVSIKVPYGPHDAPLMTTSQMSDHILLMSDVTSRQSIELTEMLRLQHDPQS